MWGDIGFLASFRRVARACAGGGVITSGGERTRRGRVRARLTTYYLTLLAAVTSASTLAAWLGLGVRLRLRLRLRLRVRLRLRLRYEARQGAGTPAGVVKPSTTSPPPQALHRDEQRRQAGGQLE